MDNQYNFEALPRLREIADEMDKLINHDYPAAVEVIDDAAKYINATQVTADVEALKVNLGSFRETTMDCLGKDEDTLASGVISLRALIASTEKLKKAMKEG